jgi:hypothetical protein
MTMDERIARKIDQNETKIVYKDHTLWLRSYELQSGGWIPRAVVVLPSADGNGERELQGQATFVEREEADEQAFLMGKEWIEQKKAGKISDQEIELP